MSVRRRSIDYSGSAPAVLTFRDKNSVITTTGTHTHSGLSFGPASSDRAIIIECSQNLWAATDNVTSVTIGGVSATRCVRSSFMLNALSGAYGITDIWIAAVPTGTSGSVVLSGVSGSTNWDSAVGVYSATKLKSLTPTAVDTNIDWNGSAYVKQLNMSVPIIGGGFAIGSAFILHGKPTSVAWTGLSSDFMQLITTPFADSGALSGASRSALASQSASMTTKFANSGGDMMQMIGAAASFR